MAKLNGRLVCAALGSVLVSFVLQCKGFASSGWTRTGMNSGRLDVKIKRVCARKRSRSILKTHLTPVRKKHDVRSPHVSIMTDSRAAEVCPLSINYFTVKTKYPAGEGEKTADGIWMICLCSGLLRTIFWVECCKQNLCGRLHSSHY